MNINIGNKVITFIDFLGNEEVWMIEDAVLILAYLKKKRKIVLGGDILTNRLEYNYDNWYYNVDLSQNSQCNIENSYIVAKEYISNYIQTNGNDFYVVFVID